MKLRPAFLVLMLLAGWSAAAESFVLLPDDPYFAKQQLLTAPRPHGPVLRPGDSLAICGDSITEQRMYSRIIETYLTVAQPTLGVRVRQFGWSGEWAAGFLARMTNDVLRFKPTVATTCYGMNDHAYRPYDEGIGAGYRSNMMAVVAAFQSIGTKVVVGSPGCMGFKQPPWSKSTAPVSEDNLSLGKLRNIDIEIAASEHTGFADVFWLMFNAQFGARQRYGANYALAGKDAVHPSWAGHTIMAYAFLKALDVSGDIGTYTVDLADNKATASSGHRVVSCDHGTVTIESSRYPFCAAGPSDADNSIRSGMALVPFNQDLNRLMLIVKHTSAKNYKVTWGDASREYAAADLEKGINLAEDFAVNPFSDAFKAVDEAVAKKQEFETDQIKNQFHGDAGKEDMEGTVNRTEAKRAELVAAIHSAFIPVTHKIAITAE
jgi:lysophospholipase L1-like esterase